MSDNRKAMVLASLAADSLALGAHWIYDAEKIQHDLGRIENYRDALPDSYHSGKTKGSYTHYGDQTVVLLQSLSADKRFSLSTFADKWKEKMSSYSGYIDQATKETLANFERGMDENNSGSSSTDLGGPARIAPLLYHYNEDLGVVLSYVKEQTAMTHNSPTALISAEFLCRVTWSVLQGETPRKAVELALDEGVNDITLDLRIRNMLEKQDGTTASIIKKCGQSCSADNALPGVIHLITTYPNNLEAALIENVMAGGDSAARGMATGMILGAHLGLEAIPEKWLTDMLAYPEIQKQLG